MNWRRMQGVIWRMRNGEVPVHYGSLDSIAFEALYDRLYFINWNARSYWVNSRFQECWVRNQCRVMITW